MTSDSNLPDRPKLRPIDVSRVTHEGSDYFLLKDLRRLSGQSLMVPVPLGLYLQGVDGTNTLNEITKAAISGGAPEVPRETLDELMGRLDDMLLLSNGKYSVEIKQLRDDFRSAPERTPALADLAYPSDTDDLRGYLDGFAFPYMNDDAMADDDLPADFDVKLKAIVSPHIDFERGGDSYGMIWEQVRDQLQDVELFVVFGTDHNGEGPRLTLTNQDYRSPLGMLETDTELVDEIARILSTDNTIDDHPFADEFNHANEHSIELATVWLHRAVGNSNAKMLPILCGSFDELLEDGVSNIDGHPEIGRVVRLLQSVADERRTMFIAAADLAHVGPAFGDTELMPKDSEDRRRVKAEDEVLLEAIVNGSRSRFFEAVKNNKDRNRICGLAPIYMTLWAADTTIGTWNGYQQCQADEDDTSFVSIAGAALFG
ncbi:MAG: AmmeMemoRadiSam system protein B [Chloroflexi bacterium]|nr:AmmeMemoRadiSam system protein B [Chloroflexota bacterium]MDA1281424.1 AmmeMemoRadiSam system protein B [Chloroflexota bacterium]